MDKKIKDYIADKKLSDEQILKALQTFKPAENGNADTSGAPDGNGDSHGADKTGATDQSTAEQSSAGTDENRDAFTKEELEKWIEDKVEAKLKSMPKNQPATIPTFENKHREKQWKVLK